MPLIVYAVDGRKGKELVLHRDDNSCWPREEPGALFLMKRDKKTGVQPVFLVGLYKNDATVDAVVVRGRPAERIRFDALPDDGLVFLGYLGASAIVQAESTVSELRKAVQKSGKTMKLEGWVFESLGAVGSGSGSSSWSQ